MPRKLLIAAAFLGLLALVAKPVCDSREQWHFGQSGDDGMYWVIAKSLAGGTGYRIASLPGAPYAIHYPPLYPLYLSLAWRWHPNFPGNLKTASALQAALLPVYLALLLGVLRQLGYSWRRTFLVAALTTVTFQLIVLTVTLFSELLFGCFLLAAILAVEHSARDENHARIGWALAGGALAGLAYLTRNAGLPLFAAVPLFYALRKRASLSLYFCAAAVPLAAAWHAWVLLHPNPDSGGYGISYFAEYLRVVRVNGPWAGIYQQLGTLSGAIAENFFPGFLRALAGIPLHHVIFAAAIAGGIRLGRRRQWPVFLIFTAFYLLLIVCWWYAGLARLVMPVWPMLVAGIAEEARHIASLFNKTSERSWSRQPALSRQLPVAVALLLACALVLRNDRAAWAMTESAMSAERTQRQRDLQALSWMREHASPDTVALAWKDAVSFLYAGIPSSHGLFLTVTPQPANLKALAAPFASLPRRYGRGLLLLLASDLGGETSGDAGGDALGPFVKQAEALPQARLEYAAPGSRIYSFTIPR